MTLDGYLNILKPPGMTSHDVVGRVRRLIRETRVGHTGTLDPAAVGVLPIAIGRATRTASSPAWDSKMYWADVAFGSATDSDDAEGEIIATAEAPVLDAAAMVTALRAFVGPIDQRPPSVSAVHVQGRRSYKAARAGEGAEPPPRRVHVDAIEVVVWKRPMLSLRIQCGSGTYIRSIARDLGRSLGSAGHLSGLVRLRVGPFSIGQAIDLMDFEALVQADRWRSVLFPLDVALLDEPAIVEHPSRSLDFVYGRQWPVLQPEAMAMTARVYTSAGALLGRVKRTDDRWQPSLGVRSEPEISPGKLR